MILITVRTRILLLLRHKSNDEGSSWIFSMIQRKQTLMSESLRNLFAEVEVSQYFFPDKETSWKTYSCLDSATPSLYQVTTGSGSPLAEHTKVPSPSISIVIFSGGFLGLQKGGTKGQTVID